MIIICQCTCLRAYFVIFFFSGKAFRNGDVRFAFLIMAAFICNCTSVYINASCTFSFKKSHPRLPVIPTLALLQKDDSPTSDPAQEVSRTYIFVRLFVLFVLVGWLVGWLVDWLIGLLL